MAAADHILPLSCADRLSPVAGLDVRKCEANVKCEGLRTPAVTNVSTRTAAGVRKPPRDETAGEGHVLGGACALSYGDLRATRDPNERQF
jgi:hypothetical protein